MINSVLNLHKGKDVKTTQSGLMYKIENAGKGDAIKATDTVKVHYTLNYQMEKCLIVP